MNDPRGRDEGTDDLTERVRVELASLLRVVPERVRPEARLVEDLNVDSLEFLTVINGLERVFDVLVPDKEAVRLRTVGQTVDLVRRLVATGANQADAPSEPSRDAAWA